ncbi:MAG: NCS2 family permease [Bacteroidetes bacterium]|nr:NCS2 family permease [Bacteroidota bacterium]
MTTNHNPNSWPFQFFRLEDRGATLSGELRAGFATFMVMAYIIFVNPSILGGAADSVGTVMPPAAILSLTCLAAGILTIFMGLYANYPFALAPGMGLNAVVAFQLVGQMGLTWGQAMTVVLIEGLIIFVLVLTKFREAMMDAIPMSLKKSIGAGIGLFLALIGGINSGIIVTTAGTPLALGNLSQISVVTFLLGLLLTVWLMARGVRGALLWGIGATTLLAITLNLMIADGTAFGGSAQVPTEFIGLPQGIIGSDSIFGRIDFGLFTQLGILAAILAVFSLLLTDFFDTMGTVVGLGEEGGFLTKEGKLPGINRVLLVDSIGAAFGGFANVSSNTTYIESAAGIAEGGRTGLTAVVVGVLFLLCMFFSPLAGIIPAEATAPALILVGFLMMGTLRDIPWKDYEESIPAFLTLLLMPLTYSITNGIGIGIITYTVLKLLAGKHHEIHWLLIVAAVAFVVYFVLSV